MYIHSGLSFISDELDALGKAYHVYTRLAFANTMNQYSGTKQKSPRRLHISDGKFAPDYQGETKHLRSMRLTDTAWKKLAEIAERNHITRTEVIEIFARHGELY